MKNTVYWIALQNIFGYGSNYIGQILDNTDDVSLLFDKKLNRKDVKFISEKHLKKLKSFDLKKAKDVIDYCERKNIKIITLDDEKYPLVLRRIKNPPAVLYVKGEFPDFDNEVIIGMVGTRDCSMNGMIVASTLAYRIAQSGAIVVSGGAMGIDTKCTQGALFAKKPSIIIRPCGVDYNYLNSLYDIRKKVEKCGAVISEVQPLGKVERDAFQIRNRIIAALSMGIVAIEVPEKSGVMITVNYSLEYGKDIFAVPGDISDERYRGSNKLLQDGAVPVYTPADVLNEFIFAYPHKLNLDKARVPINEDDVFLKLQKKYSKKVNTQKKEKIKRKNKFVSSVKDKFALENKKKAINKTKLTDLPFEADDCTKKVYQCIPVDDAVSSDYLVEKSGYETSEVMFALTELEINGVINNLPGGRIEIK